MPKKILPLRTLLLISVGFINSVGISPMLHAADLLQVYQDGLQENPSLLAAKAQFNVISENVTQSRAALLPQISGNVNISRGTTDVTSSDSSFITTGSRDTESQGYNLNLNQSLYNRAYWERLRQSKASNAQAELEYRLTEQELIITATEAYFAVLSAQDNVEFANSELKSVGKQLELSKQRYNVGLIPITDVKESQSEYDRATAAKIQADNQFASYIEALWVLTRQYYDGLANLSENVPLLDPEPADKQAWVDNALKNNLSLLANQFALDAAEHDINQTRAEHYPTLDLIAQHDYSDSEGGSFGGSEQTQDSLMLQLHVPIYSGGATSSRVRQSVYRSEALRQQAEDTRRRVIRQTRDAYLNVSAGIARVNALKQSMISTQAAYDATNVGFRVGTRNTTEVLRSLRDTFGAKRDYAQARYEYVLNHLRLKQAVGTLSIADLQLINQWMK
ncbi:MAG: TolC family outer membrane protein [Gammaproteobacteria bacterium]|nr:TolC family outer membrane protein [Gammaproteobacteria bacterium]